MSTGGSASHDVRPVVGSHNSSTVRLAGSTSNASGAGTGAGHQHNAARSSDVSNVDRSASRMTVNQGRIYTGSASSGHGPSTSSANGNGQQHYRTDSDAATNPAAPLAALERMKLVGGLRASQHGISNMDKLRQQQHQAAPASTGSSRPVSGPSSKAPLKSALASSTMSNTAYIGAELPGSSYHSSRVVADSAQAVQDLFLKQVVLVNNSRTVRPYHKTVDDLENGVEPADALEKAHNSSYTDTNVRDGLPASSSRNGCDARISVYFPTLTSRNDEHSELESRKICFGICRGKKHPDSGPFCRFCRTRVTKRGENYKACYFNAYIALLHLDEDCQAFAGNEHDRVLWTNAFRRIDANKLKQAAETVGVRAPDLAPRQVPPKPIVAPQRAAPPSSLPAKPTLASTVPYRQAQPNSAPSRPSTPNPVPARNAPQLPSFRASLKPVQAVNPPKPLFISPDNTLEIAETSNEMTFEGLAQDYDFTQDALKDEEIDELASVESGEIPERREPVLRQLAMSQHRQRNDDEFRYETINPPVAQPIAATLPSSALGTPSKAVPKPTLKPSTLPARPMSPASTSFNSIVPPPMTQAPAQPRQAAIAAVRRIPPQEADNIDLTASGKASEAIPAASVAAKEAQAVPERHIADDLDDDLDVLAMQKSVEASRLAREKKRKSAALEVLSHKTVAPIAADLPNLTAAARSSSTVTTRPAIAAAPSAAGMSYTRNYEWPAMPSEPEAFIRPEKVVADQQRAKYNALPSFTTKSTNCKPDAAAASPVTVLKPAHLAVEQAEQSNSIQMSSATVKVPGPAPSKPSSAAGLDALSDGRVETATAGTLPAIRAMPMPSIKVASNKASDAPTPRPATVTKFQKSAQVPAPIQKQSAASESSVKGKTRLVPAAIEKASDEAFMRKPAAVRSHSPSPDLPANDDSAAESDSSSGTLQADPRSDDESDDSDCVRVVATRPTSRTSSAVSSHKAVTAPSLSKKQSKQERRERRKRSAPQSGSDAETEHTAPAAPKERKKAKKIKRGSVSIGRPVIQPESVQRLQQPIISRPASSPVPDGVQNRKRHITVSSGESDSEDVPLVAKVKATAPAHPPAPAVVVATAPLVEAEPLPAIAPAGVRKPKKKKPKKKHKMADHTAAAAPQQSIAPTWQGGDLQETAYPHWMLPSAASGSGDIPAGLSAFANVWLDAKLSLDDLRQHLTEPEVPSFVEELAASSQHVELDNPLKRWGFRKALTGLLGA